MSCVIASLFVLVHLANYLIESVDKLLTNNYNLAKELFQLLEFYYCIKENANRENERIIKCTGGIKTTYKKGEIATLEIPKKLRLNKLELTYLSICILEKKISKKDVHSTFILRVVIVY